MRGLPRLFCTALSLFTLGLGLCAQPTISGLVRNANGNPLVGADLDVFDLQDNLVAVTGDTTLADGTYTIVLPGPCAYVVRVDLPTGSPLVDQYYNGAFLRSQATPIQVPSDTSQITGINFPRSGGFASFGRVTANGLPAGNIDLDLYAATGEFIGNYPARTAADGTFTIGALPNGSYYLKADPDPSLGQYSVFRFYGGSQDIATATPIVINQASATVITWDLPSGGIISGIIQSDTGVPLAGVDLDVFDLNDNRLPYNGKSLADGSYFFGPLPAGSYKLRADPAAEIGYVRRYYGDGNEPDLAGPIAVSLNQTTGGINFSLLPGGTVSGLITGPAGQPVPGIDIDIYDSLGGRVNLTTKSGADGRYLIGALPSGSYTLRADPALQSGFAGRYYGGTNAPSSAIPFNVIAGQDTSNISIQLPSGGWLEGTIRNADGAAVAGIDLDAYDTIGTRLLPTARTALDGSYAIGPFPTGSIILRADPEPTDGVAHAYYPNADDIANAAPIPVPAGSATTGIDFSLPHAGWITGTIRDLSGNPLAGIDLDLYDSLGTRISLNAASNTDGSYLMGPVPIGNVLLRADPLPMQGSARRYYPDAPLESGAVPIAVLKAVPTSGIDLALPPAGWILGTVRNAGGQALAGIDIDLYNASTGQRVSTGNLSAVDGTYLLGPLEFGSYHVRADPTPAQPYVREYYFDAPTLGTAAPVVIFSTSGNTGIDFSLTGGGSVSGTVLLPDGQPAASIDMDILDAVTGVSMEQDVVTSLDGTYIFPPVPYGSYIVRADPLDTLPYLDTYYTRSAFPDSATILSVSPGAGPAGISIQLLPYTAPSFSRSDSADTYAVLSAGSGSVTFNVSAPSGDVVEMRFYVEGTRVFRDTTAPFGFTAADLPFGVYSLVPAARDIYGRTTYGAPIAIINPEFTPSLSEPLYTAIPDASRRLLVAWQAENGISYRIEVAAALAGPWSLLHSATGSGGLQTFVETAPLSPARFLRIIQGN